MERDSGVSSDAPGRLTARPDPAAEGMEAGLYELELGDERDGVLYVPDADGPLPLLLVLHGATMNAKQMLRPVLSAADEAEVILLVPDSRGQTWDVIMGGYGPDVDFIDAALAATFAKCRVDPNAVSIGGVSDGASYALSLGVANGDLFGKILAFSPGFIAPPDVVGKPRVFISHGTHDRILPIDACGRPIAFGLQKGEYDVEFLEFDGGHEMPEPVVRAGFTWLRG